MQVLGMPADQRAKYELESDPDKYAYMVPGSGKATPRRGGEKADFAVVAGVLQMLQASEVAHDALWRVLSGLLSLGSVMFAENGQGDAMVQNVEQLARANKLFGANQQLLQQALTSRTMKVRRCVQAGVH